MNAVVYKVSPSGKTMLVGAQPSEFSIGYEFGWCRNPQSKFKKGDTIDMFKPAGKRPLKDDKGNVKTYTDGNPIMEWTF